MSFKLIKSIALGVFSIIIFNLCVQGTQATVRMPTESLDSRVKNADVVFLGKLKNKEIKGEWVTAELHVETPLSNAEEKQVFKVTWRTQVGNLKLFDEKEGARGIAILKGKRNERYWLRNDKFESTEKLAEVKRILKSFLHQGAQKS